MGWLKDPHAVNRGLSRMLGYLGDAIPQYMMQKQANQRHEAERAAQDEYRTNLLGERTRANDRADEQWGVEKASLLREPLDKIREGVNAPSPKPQTFDQWLIQEHGMGRITTEQMLGARGKAKPPPKKTGLSDAQLRLYADNYRKTEMGRLSGDIHNRMNTLDPDKYQGLITDRTLPSDDPAILGPLIDKGGPFRVMTKDNWGPWNEHGADPEMTAKLDTLNAHYNTPTVDYLPMMRERATGGYLSGPSGDAMDQWGRSVYQDGWDGLTTDQKQTLYEGYNK